MADGSSAGGSLDYEATKVALLAKINELIANPLPTYDVDGTRFEWNELRETYRRLLSELDARDSSMPYEFTTVYLDPNLET